MTNLKAISGLLVMIFLLIPLILNAQQDQTEPPAIPGDPYKPGSTGIDRKVHIQNKLDKDFAPLLYGKDGKEFQAKTIKKDNWGHYNSTTAIKIGDKKYSLKEGQTYHIIEKEIKENNTTRKIITIVHIVQKSEKQK